MCVLCVCVCVCVCVAKCAPRHSAGEEGPQGDHYDGDAPEGGGPHGGRKHHRHGDHKRKQKVAIADVRRDPEQDRDEQCILGTQMTKSGESIEIGEIENNVPVATEEGHAVVSDVGTFEPIQDDEEHGRDQHHCRYSVHPSAGSVSRYGHM